MLLVALHSFEGLPAPLAQAANAVAEVLPATDLSADVADVPVDGVALPETSVPAACLDLALPPDTVHGARGGARVAAGCTGALALSAGVPKRPTEEVEVPEELLGQLDRVVGGGPEAEAAVMAKVQAALTNKRLRRAQANDAQDRKG